MLLYDFDDHYRSKGYAVVAGVDEAGRGPWAGPVVAAAVILPEIPHISGLNDSKKLSPLQREKAFLEITSHAIAIGVEIINHDVIDAVNIGVATYRAMQGAVARIGRCPDMVLIDGLPVPSIAGCQESIVAGDGKSACIAAASIIAKVTRDRIMMDMGEKYPCYNFQKHKGYGTKEHRSALEKYGPCPIHRKSFEPIKSWGDAGNE
ncbi:MAG: ribonuclease HII [Elusimicrobia bacterium RIFOXYA2_FULL_50_26]|nr:MAG: ribonuclease HII [Elusimicrobia bacterium RIFOXYA2_FULL_50_26]OGS25172.1 MAG: ribonuclease HII [Elusimicrobia bacterium RIFOXYB2_FULL_50_12]